MVPVDNVFSNEELLGGTVVAVGLASLASFLQGRRAQNDFILGKTSDDDVVVSSTVVEEEKDRPLDDAGTMSSHPGTLIVNTTSDTITAAMDSTETTPSDVNATSTTAFTNWDEMSRPENYVWYNRPRRKNSSTSSNSSNALWSFWALLLVFGPIFSFEFFLTLSRQVLCGLLHSDMCAPIV